MKDKSLFYFMIIGLFFVSNAYAQNNDKESNNIIKTSYFSIEPLDNWTYEINSDKTTAQQMGSDARNEIILYPNDIDIGTAVEAGNAVIANFMQDNTYNVNNAPLSQYVKYHTENAIAPITSQEDITIDGEPAVKVLTTGKGDSGEIKSLFIYTIHKNKYYSIGLLGNTNNFNRYLPEFEQMLNTFKFIETTTTTDTVDKESSGVDLSDIKETRTDIEIDDSNFDLFYSNPESHISKKISITGKIFNIMTPSGDSAGIQIYHLGDRDKDTIISYSLSQIGNYFSDDECVKIQGIAGPTYQYTNAFGAYRTSPMIFATSIQKIDCLDMVDPKAKIIPIGQSLEKGGIKVTLNKVEFDDKNTRAFLTIENTNDDEDEILRFYDTSDSKAFQGKRQYEVQYSSSYPDISSSIPPGIEESGVVLFEPLEYGMDTKFQFDMNIGLDDYTFVFNTNTIGQLNAPEVLTFTEDKASEVLRQGDEDDNNDEVLTLRQGEDDDEDDEEEDEDDEDDEEEDDNNDEVLTLRQGEDDDDDQ